jgi:hypothetical protein
LLDSAGGRDIVRNSRVADAAGRHGFAVKFLGSQGATTVTLENTIVQGRVG